MKPPRAGYIVRMKQKWTGALGAPTIQNGYLWALSAWGSRWYLGVLGCAGAPEVFKIPGSVTKRIFPPNSFLLWGIKATYHEVFRPRGEERGGGCCYPLPPLERINSMCKLKRARGRCFQTMSSNKETKIQLKYSATYSVF